MTRARKGHLRTEQLKTIIRMKLEDFNMITH